MNKIFFLALLMHVTLIFSQDVKKGSIYGIVKNSVDKNPIAFASVVCKDLDNNIITGAITNDTGNFIIKKLKLGSLNVEIQFMGYKAFSKQITLTNENSKYYLEDIFLEVDNTLLNEVEIQAEESTIIQKADKKIINVGKDLLATGSNSFQMLQNIPSVNVDFQSGTISLRGNENVRVLINGKPSNLSTEQLLKQTPSSIVKSIEIITSPSSKYTPEGMSGIINFVLKKNIKLGLNATISAGVEHSKETRPDASLSINYNTGKLNFFGDFSTGFGKSITINKLERLNENLIQDIHFLHDYTDFSYKVGVDYYLNEKNTLSFYNYRSSSNSTLDTDTSIQIDNTFLNTPNISTYKEPEETYNLDYKLDINDNENIELEINYTFNNATRFDENTLLEDTTTKLYNYTNNIIDEQQSLLINLDYTRVIFNDGKLEFGLEYRDQNSFNSIITDQTIEIGNPAIETLVGNTTFNYDRSIYSTYINLQKRIAKFSIQAGIRLEQFKVHGLFSNTQQFDDLVYLDEIFNAYPSVFITYNINDENTIAFSYNKRVDRPALYQVTPIQEWSSPLTISIGNQNLKPQFTNSVELNYTRNFKKGQFTIGAFYRKISDKIGNSIFLDQDDTSRQIFSFDNFNNAENFGVEMSASYKAFSWWTLNPSLELYSQDAQGIINNEFITINNTLFRSNLRNSFKISNRLRLQLTSIYKGENQNVQYRVAPYSMVNIGATLSVLDKKGTISLRGTDIFNGVNFNYYTTNPIVQQGFYDLEINAIYLGFSYSFEGIKNKTRERKYRDDNESNPGLF